MKEPAPMPAPLDTAREIIERNMARDSYDHAQFVCEIADAISDASRAEREACAVAALSWSTVSEGAHVIAKGIAEDIRARTPRHED